MFAAIVKKESPLSDASIPSEPSLSPFDRNLDEFTNEEPQVVHNLLEEIQENLIYENGTRVDDYLRSDSLSTKKVGPCAREKAPNKQIPTDEQIRHAKTEGALIMQSVALIAASSGLISGMIEKAFQKGKNSISAKFFSAFMGRYKREFDEILFTVIMEFVTDFDKGKMDAILSHLEETQRRELDRKKSDSNRNYSMRKLNSLVELFNSSDDDTLDFDPCFVNACNKIIEDLRSYPTVQHPTKQELVLVKLRDAPGHVVSEENLKRIFGRSSNSARNLHRKLPDINQRLKPHGFRIQRPDAYMAEGIPT